jgi:hypothetical protein
MSILLGLEPQKRPIVCQNDRPLVISPLFSPGKACLDSGPNRHQAFDKPIPSRGRDLNRNRLLCDFAVGGSDDDGNLAGPGQHRGCKAQESLCAAAGDADIPDWN